VFCLDVTGSMDMYIDGTIKTIVSLVKAIADTKTTDTKNTKFGFVGYRDHQNEHQHWSYLTKIKNLTEATKLEKFI